MTRRSFPSRALRVPLLLAGALLPAAGCGHAAAANPAPTPDAPLPTPVQVTWVTAEERLLPEQVVVTGDLRAEARIDVSAEVEGRVVGVALERGQTVRAGELLVELDPRDAKNRLAEAEAVQAQIEARLGLADRCTFDPEQTPDVRLARVNMERAKTEAGRYERLVTDGAVARSLHDVERANYAVAKERHAAEVDRMRESWRSLQAQQARVAMARKAVEDTQLRAPWSGVVHECLVDEGQYVKKGERLAVLVKVDSLRTALAVPEARAAAVRQGQKVVLAVRSRPGEEFEGFVTWVGPGLDTASRSLTVEVLVDNVDGRLQPGAFATARIDLPAVQPSVVVACNAIVSTHGIHHVFVIDGDRLGKRLVQIGRDLDGVVEVVRGLAAGEKVAIVGSARLVDGAIVAAAAAGE